MAAKAILKDAKAPVLFLRSPFLAAAAVTKPTSPNPQLIFSIQPSDQIQLPHLSVLRHFLNKQPPPKLDGLVPAGKILGSTLWRLQARGSDHEEENDSCDDWSSDDDDDEEDMDDYEDTSDSDGCIGWTIVHPDLF